MPYYVERNTAGPQALATEEFTVEAARNCTLESYEPISVPSFDIDEEIIAYASPDSTYAVTKQFFDSAKKSIRIGIYDFSASYVKDLILDAMGRGVEVTLMLDVDSEKEQAFFDDLTEMGVDGVVAPACSSPRARYFSSCHEKFIVIDDTWTLVQSGNYSTNSIPLNETDGGDPDAFKKGNRDTGLAIKSKKLAKFFTKILRSDIDLVLNGPEALHAPVATDAPVFWVEAVPKKIPSELFMSKRFDFSSRPLTIQPILSPDNYMTDIPPVLAGAKKSILIEQQYIRGRQAGITLLLQAIAAAMQNNADLDVRIVLGKLFDAEDIKNEKQNLALLASIYGLKLGTHIRFIDTTRFVHCHNKMILVDGNTVLVSSQNWSDSAVRKNREAGILLTHKPIATYFTKIFESDWSTGIKKVPIPAKKKLKPETLARGGFVRVVPADYREV